MSSQHNHLCTCCGFFLQKLYFAVNIQQFLWKIAVFLPQFLYICSRKHQIYYIFIRNFNPKRYSVIS